MRRVADLEIPMCTLLAGARRKQASLIALTRRLVQAESPSDDKAAVDACVALAAAHARDLGGRVKLHRQRGFGDVLEARFGPRKTAAAEAYPAARPSGYGVATGHAQDHAVPAERRPVLGAGHLDMKAGVAMALTALELLTEADLLRARDRASAQRRRGDRQPGFAAGH